MADKFMDNRKVKEDHQEGISRVIQRKGDLEKGQGGRMKAMPAEQANWRRTGGKLTPRQG